MLRIKEKTIGEDTIMAHICPKCFEHAPLLFRFCPECDFDMIKCKEEGCDHCWSTREEMMKDER